MPSLNFSVFVPFVKNGLRQLAGEDVTGLRVKRQTIREGERFKVGDDLYLFEGLRTKKCRRLGQAICTAAIPIAIDDPDGRGLVAVNGKDLDENEVAELAYADGFNSDFAMFMFFEKRLPFVGQIVKW